MINTATDNIQYRGDVGRSIYQKNQVYRRPESEHYKVCMGSWFIRLVFVLFEFEFGPDFIKFDQNCSRILHKFGKM